MNWLQEAVTSPNTGKTSSSRVVSVTAGLTLSFCTLVLTVGAFFEVAMLQTLAIFGPSLAGLAGANYVANRMSNKT